MNEVFERTYGELLAWCHRHVWRGLGDPEDFVHQAYLRSRKGWSASNRSTDGEWAYFFRALRWVVADAIRVWKRRRLVTQPRKASFSAGNDPVREMIAREALDVLTERERAICAGFLAGQTERQLCATLAISRCAVAVHASRARRKLYGYLKSPLHGRPDFARD